MNVRQHAFLARALQDACGGPDACLELLEPTPFKMGRTHLYECRDASCGRTMPIGAIAFLEQHQSWRLYSMTLVRQVAPPTEDECAFNEACEGNEAMSEAQRLVRLAAADGVYTEFEKREIEPVLQQVEARIAGIRRGMDAQPAIAAGAAA